MANNFNNIDNSFTLLSEVMKAFKENTNELVTACIKISDMQKQLDTIKSEISDKVSIDINRIMNELDKLSTEVKNENNLHNSEKNEIMSEIDELLEKLNKNYQLLESHNNIFYQKTGTLDKVDTKLDSANSWIKIKFPIIVTLLTCLSLCFGFYFTFQKIESQYKPVIDRIIKNEVEFNDSLKRLEEISKTAHKDIIIEQQNNKH